VQFCAQVIGNQGLPNLKSPNMVQKVQKRRNREKDGYIAGIGRDRSARAVRITITLPEIECLSPIRGTHERRAPTRPRL
jgi:hypothetical protein